MAHYLNFYHYFFIIMKLLVNEYIYKKLNSFLEAKRKMKAKREL